MSKTEPKFKIGQVGPVKCGECGAEMQLRKSPKFPKPFWGCTKFPACRGAHGAHPNGRPLGVPANAETKAARIRAHDVFDRLWLSKITMTRTKAYKLLAAKLGLEEVHIGESDIAQCGRIIVAANELLNEAVPETGEEN